MFFFKTHSYYAKSNASSDDIKHFFNLAFQGNQLFVVIIPSVKAYSLSKIIAIDNTNQQIKCRDSSYALKNLTELVGGFAITVELRKDNHIMQFESTLLKDHNYDDQYLIDFPKQITQTNHRHEPRFKPREDISIAISFRHQKKWKQFALLTDVSVNGLGLEIKTDFWSHINRALTLDVCIRFPRGENMYCAIDIVHTFIEHATGSKHAGAKFIYKNKAKRQALQQMLRNMREIDQIVL